MPGSVRPKRLALTHSHVGFGPHEAGIVAWIRSTSVAQQRNSTTPASLASIMLLPPSQVPIAPIGQSTVTLTVPELQTNGAGASIAASVTTSAWDDEVHPKAKLTAANTASLWNTIAARLEVLAIRRS
jgi:hypothetical protein